MQRPLCLHLCGALSDSVSTRLTFINFPLSSVHPDLQYQLSLLNTWSVFAFHSISPSMDRGLSDVLELFKEGHPLKYSCI